MKKDLPTYQITIQDPNSEEELGIDQIAFVKNPAIVVKGVAFSMHNKQKFASNELKMRVAAPALIPGEIYRNDEDGEYYVEFTAEEIEVIYKDFMSKLSQKKDVFNLEHTSKTIPAFVLEALLCDTDTKLNYIKDEYGIDLPMGSMFIVSQFTDENYYNEIVKNDRAAYSIEGFLSLKLSEIIKQKEQMEKEQLLAQIEELKLKLQAFETAEAPKEEEKVEEVAAETEVSIEVEDEKKEEEMLPEEEVAMETEEVIEEKTEVSMTEEEIAKIVEEKIEARLAEVTEMLADMKLKLEDMKPAAEEEGKKVQLSAHEMRIEKAKALAKAFGARF